MTPYSQIRSSGQPLARLLALPQQQQLQSYSRSIRWRRSFSSKDDSVTTKNSAPPSKEKKRIRAGPVFIKDTPRSAASERLRPTGRLEGPNLEEHRTPHIVNGSLTDPSGHRDSLIYGDTPADSKYKRPRFQLSDYGEESLYTLILLRHGESEWNSQNRYTGWCDVNLTKKGEMEARTAGRLLHQNGIEVDHAFTSVLRRASFSCNMALNMAEQHWVPVTKTWRLNERHYGALQGYNKDTAFEELNLDQELVMQMRRSYDVRPPTMEDDHPFWHGHDRRQVRLNGCSWNAYISSCCCFQRDVCSLPTLFNLFLLYRYRKLTPDQLERSRAESLKDTADRIMPFFNSVIATSMRAGNKCIIVSHANTIRTLIKQIDGISDEDIKGMTIPTGIPLLYRLDKNLKPVDPQIELEFRYMVEPKGYVMATFDGLMDSLHAIYSKGCNALLTYFLIYSHPQRSLYAALSFTWGTSRAHGFHGVYLGDLERLQDIQKKRDVTNRNWQRIILKNIGKTLGWNFDELEPAKPAPRTLLDPHVISTRQLWWQVHNKMQSPDYRNMLLLNRMADLLEDLMHDRKQRFLTKDRYEKIIDKLHLDAEGSVVEPFVDLADRVDRDERQRQWETNMAMDLEEECLIK